MLLTFFHSLLFHFIRWDFENMKFLLLIILLVLCFTQSETQPKRPHSGKFLEFTDFLTAKHCFWIHFYPLPFPWNFLPTIHLLTSFCNPNINLKNIFQFQFSFQIKHLKSLSCTVCIFYLVKPLSVIVRLIRTLQY